MTITDNTAELWAPGIDTQNLSPVDAPGLERVQVTSSHPDTTACRLNDDGTIRITIAAQAGRRTVAVTAPGRDAVALWRPGSTSNRAVISPSWAGLSVHGPFSGTFLGSLVARDGSSIGFGAVAGDQIVRARCGMVEESANLLIMAETDAADADLEMVLDLRGLPFADSVGDVGRQLGMHRRRVSCDNERPVLCTWYSFHQDLAGDAVVEEAAEAAALGFGTVIVDDGWQNDDTDRGYGSCGDWEINAAKVGDGASFVRALHAHGLNVLWWVGTPFIGYRSRAHQTNEFAALYEEPGMDASVLDPRVPAVRSRLAGQLAELIHTTAADGLKLDFLERFAPSADAVGSEGDADSVSAEVAGVQLVDDIVAAVAAAGRGTEPMIEFREPYISAQTVARGTMLRVGDCPLSPIQNRLGVIDLRLVTRGIAVHSDPIMWAPDDSAERVAQHLLSSLFAVPQVSVMLRELPSSHRKVLAHWIGFWNQHAELLLGESLVASGVEQNYPVAQVRDAAEVITARYGAISLVAPEGDWTTWHIVNADADGVFVEGMDAIAAEIEIVDCAGVSRGLSMLEPAALRRLPVPAGGRARIVRTAATR